MQIVFTGDEADSHRIEAYTGAASLEGIARAATLAAHYAATGQVRFRAPYSDDVEFHISAPKDGSLKFPLEVLCRLTGAMGQHKKKVAAAILLAILARGSGQTANEGLRVEGETISPGTLDALAEAATPGLERAHRWIDTTKKTISVQGAASEGVVFDSQTKDYLQDEDIGRRASQDVTVSALNANNKTGRVYFEDLGRTIPFKVAKEAKGRTTSNLSRFLVRYVDKNNEWVNIDYLPVYYSDGRLKRVVIYDCERASDRE